MKKQKKFLVIIIAFLFILLSGCRVFATVNNYGEMKFSEEYLEYLKREDKEGIIAPRMYDIPKTTTLITNPLRFARILGSTNMSSYSLRDIIPANMVIKDQQETNTCWAFGSLAALESNLALKDYKNGITSPLVYDFSERHMEYATSKTFSNGTNVKGFNREVGDGGSYNLYIPYLTNGTGAIAETEMPFENNENKIELSKIQNKNVITQVNDIVIFPSYLHTDDLTQIKQQMKEHIQNYGAIEAGIHGASLFASNSTCYNSETGAIYCNNSDTYPVDHSVAIVGWDDNYNIENFLESNRPTSNGAWIIKNSWGTEERYTLTEMKQIIFDVLRSECEEQGWTDATQIPDSVATAVFVELGYTIDANNEAVQKIGDDGFMYVSYEDANIYTRLVGIENAQNKVEYDNIYQYDEYAGYYPVGYKGPKIYLATVFNKKTSASEYLTQVSIYASETYTCKVYVNPNGTSKAMSDLQQIQLKAGETETFNAGYHTIEFLNPLQITGDSFVVVLEVQGTEASEYIGVMSEFNYGQFIGNDGSIGEIYNNVTIESGKCFVATETEMAVNQWSDTSKAYTESNGQVPSFDTTIKAFTVSNLEILESIEIATPPTKTSYIVGDNFDATGMVVRAKYIDGTSKEITDYTISNGTNLQVNQTSVTIEYQGKTTTQAIEVTENLIEKIAITTPPTKTEYFAGDDFDTTGMVIQATYKDGTVKQVTDYNVKDGTNLKNGQTTVTIAVGDKTITQAITVKANSVVKIEIAQAPNKVKYIVGQSFDATGMVVKATYANGTVIEVKDYTVTGGSNLKADQTTVTIEYEGLTITQAITIEVKSVASISVKTNPTKTEYIQNKEELDLTGGVIQVNYNDSTKEEISMTSNDITVSGFDNKKVGTKTLTLKYLGKTTQFEVKVIEEAKPKNSDFNNMKGNVTRVRAYFFTDVTKKSYEIVSILLDDIIKSKVNDNMQYYYYLSSNPSEANIANWIKINNLQDSEKGLSFEINTSELSNYEEISQATDLYLYIKEVATRNNITSEVVTSPVLLDIADLTIEEYIDGEKIADVDPDEIITGGTGAGTGAGEDPDDTLASNGYNNAGTSLLILFVIFVIFVIGRIAYLKYRDIQIK